MTPLFASVYLDEDVSVMVADLLRARGFQTVTARDAGQLGQTDSSQLEYSAVRDFVKKASHSIRGTVDAVISL